MFRFSYLKKKNIYNKCIPKALIALWTNTAEKPISMSGVAIDGTLSLLSFVETLFALLLLGHM